MGYLNFLYVCFSICFFFVFLYVCFYMLVYMFICFFIYLLNVFFFTLHRPVRSPPVNETSKAVFTS